MENPNRSAIRAALFFIGGVLFGLIPGQIKIDQMRREMASMESITSAEMAKSQSAIAEAEEAINRQKTDCQSAILGDGARTILVDQNHPYGGYAQNILGVSLLIPPPVSRVSLSPIWIVPRNITPAVVDGVLGGSYIHVWPDGRTDGWHVAGGPR